jgi:hypothetical protein
MSMAPSLGIPPLAGICGYADAAHGGLGVDENVRRLLRFQWIEQRLALAAVAHIPGTPEWEVKGGLSLHQWLDTEHADAIGRRITELRHPAPRMDQAPDAPLDAFLAELLEARDTVELLSGLYGVAHPALLEAYRRHLEESNPLVDHVTCRILRGIVGEEAEMVAWGAAAAAALARADDDGRRALEWQEHLRAYLAAAGGIAGPCAVGETGASLPPARAAGPFRPRLEPRRDARFRGAHNFNFPPHLVYAAGHVPADERNLALLCKRLLEMDVPEMIASILVERPDRPWEFRRDFSRQLWDEARHSMMGEVALEARGVDWTSIPLNVGFSLRLNTRADPLERQLVLFAIEQGLMPRETGKRFEYETARAAGDALSVLFHDYDWADEVLHTQIGRRWIRHEGLTLVQAQERARIAQERTWAALQEYREDAEQAEWWQDFVQQVLGHATAARPDELQESTVLTE